MFDVSALLVHEVLRKVPVDWFLVGHLLEEAIERDCVGSVHIDLIHEEVLGPHGLSRKLLDLLVGARFLMKELIARKRDYLEPLRVEPLM